jgi:predicted SprT family Zn-dependent metalloprotease
MKKTTIKNQTKNEVIAKEIINSMVKTAQELGMVYGIEKINFVKNENLANGSYNHFDSEIRINVVFDYNMENRTIEQMINTLGHELGHAIDFQSFNGGNTGTFMDKENRADYWKGIILERCL